MKNAVFWNVALCRSCVNRRFGGTYRPHFQGRKTRERRTSVSKWQQTPAHTVSSLADIYFSSTLKMEVIRSSETSVDTIPTWRHIPQDSILQKLLYLYLFKYVSHQWNFKINFVDIYGIYILYPDYFLVWWTFLRKLNLFKFHFKQD
jgi:hypothetical protein